MWVWFPIKSDFSLSLSLSPPHMVQSRRWSEISWTLRQLDAPSARRRVTDDFSVIFQPWSRRTSEPRGRSFLQPLTDGSYTTAAGGAERLRHWFNTFCPRHLHHLDHGCVCVCVCVTSPQLILISNCLQCTGMCSGVRKPDAPSVTSAETATDAPEMKMLWW